jgi:hypothetical protein
MHRQCVWYGLFGVWSAISTSRNRKRMKKTNVLTGALREISTNGVVSDEEMKATASFSSLSKKTAAALEIKLVCLVMHDVVSGHDLRCASSGNQPIVKCRSYIQNHKNDVYTY